MVIMMKEVNTIILSNFRCAFITILPFLCISLEALITIFSQRIYKDTPQVR